MLRMQAILIFLLKKISHKWEIDSITAYAPQHHVLNTVAYNTVCFPQIDECTVWAEVELQRALYTQQHKHQMDKKAFCDNLDNLGFMYLIWRISRIFNCRTRNALIMMQKK